MEKHICFVHIGMARDGAERVIARLSNMYAHKGYMVDIIVLLLDECGYELHDNVRIVSLVRNDMPRKKNILYWIRGIRRFVKETNPEHVIAFSMYVNIFTLIACMGLKRDILISERNDPSSDGRSKIDIALTRLLYPFADKIVFQTNRAQNCFSKRIKDKSKIIVNPVEIACEAEDQKDNKIVTVGRLESQKNQSLLLRAFAKLHSDYSNINLEIYGKGGLLDELVSEAKELGILDRVEFMGNVPDVHYRIRNAIMFVLSSDFEGLSNALLEAMMMGIPCISTNCAGSDEVIRNEKNGLLVNVGDEDGLYMAMKKLLENNELRKDISNQAKSDLSVFKSDKVLSEWMNYIDSEVIL